MQTEEQLLKLFFVCVVFQDEQDSKMSVRATTCAVCCDFLNCYRLQTEIRMLL